MLAHGGKRKGSGRKRKHSPGVAHREREKVIARTPVHINFKYRCSIRNKYSLRLLKRAILNARKLGMHVIHYSLQRNHVHLIIEATDNATLSSGMRSITVTIAMGLRMGKVQIGRYHLHVLRTLRETRNAIHYVLFNEQRHGGKVVGKYSSILNLKGALLMIRRYAREKRITLRVEKGELLTLQEGESYFIRRALRDIVPTTS